MATGQEQPFVGYMVVDQQGRIADVGAGSPPAGIAAREKWDAHGEWVIPGFISAHSHLWQAAFRGLAADKTLPGWLDALYGDRARYAKPDDFYWFTLDGALDHLEHGITSAYDFSYGGSMWGPGGGNAADKASFRAEMDSGIRFVHGFDPDKIGPADTAEMARARLKDFLDWTGTQPESTRFLGVMLNGWTSFNETEQQAVFEKQAMDEFHIGNQSHYLEPPDTIDSERAKWPWFKGSGLLSPTLYFGHFIHPTDQILDDVAAAHGGMSWNPLSNGRLASGVADIPKYWRKGIRIGMGVDGEASADVADPFENMRTGLFAIRDLYQSANAMSPYQVLYFHTVGSADVMGMKDKLGSLEKGKFADFLVIDPARLGTIFDPYASLVLVTAERDVDRVYVGGVLKVKRGALVGQNVKKVEAEANRRAEASHAP
jgi:cytosine/adenosine deaminase-related metal-dependent hydrolase